jgi:hypothetical protein
VKSVLQLPVFPAVPSNSLNKELLFFASGPPTAPLAMLVAIAREF